jgi:hypothetical protein
MSSREEKQEAKRARRKFRHEIARRMRRIAIKRIGLHATGPQLDLATKTLTDRYMHKVDHAPVKVAPVPEAVPPRASEVEPCPAS